MATRDMTSWETGISEVVSRGDEEEVIVRGHRLTELIGRLSFAEMMFLVLQGAAPSPPQARMLDALLVASVEHGIAPPSMISRCFASYGTSIQAAVGGGVLAFGDRMGGLGEQFAKLLVDWLIGDAEPAAIDQAAREIVDDAVRAGRRIPGFGIPLHRTDPRAPKLLAVARAEGIHGPHCRLAEAIERALAARRGGRPVPLNLDGAGAAIVLDLGFSWRATRIFLITPRTVSMAAHYLEEQDQDTAWRHIPADRITYDR